MNDADKMTRLEGLVQEAARRLKQLGSENLKLTSALKDLQLRQKEMQVKLREQEALKVRHQKVRKKVEKLLGVVEKLDKLQDQEAPAAPQTVKEPVTTAPKKKEPVKEPVAAAPKPSLKPVASVPKPTPKPSKKTSETEALELFPPEEVHS